MPSASAVPTPDELESELSAIGPAAAVVVLSQAMVAAARADDWDVVTRLERKRQELLVGLIERREAPPNEALTDCMRQVLGSDRELIALGEERRAAVGAQLAALGQGRRARLAYTETSGG